MLYQQVTPEKARQEILTLPNVNEGLKKILADERTLFFPLIASSGYFDKANTQSWMTIAQWMDIVKGTRTLVHAVNFVSEFTGRPVLLTGYPPFVKMAVETAQREVKRAPFVDLRKETPEFVSPNLYIAESPVVRQSKYGNLLRAGVPIFRTSQANTFWECVYTGTPSVIIGMPWHGYMDAEEYDRNLYHLGLRVFEANASPLNLADRLIALATSPYEAQSISRKQLNIAMDVYANPGNNFQYVLDYLAGISS
jgi:hypothetical protein